MASLLLSKELAMSLRALSDLAFAASLLMVRWIMVLIAEARVIHNGEFRKVERARRRVVLSSLTVDAENVR